MKTPEDRRSARPAVAATRGPSPRELAGLLPDEPRYIDLRGLLLAGRCDIWAGPRPESGFVAGSWDYPFAAVHGRPGAGLITAATASGRAASAGRYPLEEWQLLAAPEERPVMEAALRGWRPRAIAIHRLAGRRERPEASSRPEVCLLPDGHRGSGLALDHLPEPSRLEYALDWVSRRPMAVAVVDGRPVSFCYAAFTTERWWDVSVETLEPFRRRGLAAACFLTLAAHMAELGLEPVWGAMLDNPASLGLAARLGFVRDSTIDGWSEDGPD